MLEGENKGSDCAVPSHLCLLTPSHRVLGDVVPAITGPTLPLTCSVSVKKKSQREWVGVKNGSQRRAQTKPDLKGTQLPNL